MGKYQLYTDTAGDTAASEDWYKTGGYDDYKKSKEFQDFQTQYGQKWDKGQNQFRAAEAERDLQETHRRAWLDKAYEGTDKFGKQYWHNEAERAKVVGAGPATGTSGDGFAGVQPMAPAGPGVAPGLQPPAAGRALGAPVGGAPAGGAPAAGRALGAPVGGAPAGGAPGGSRPGFAGVMPAEAGGKNLAMPGPGERGPSGAYTTALGQPALAGAPAGTALQGAAGTTGATAGKGFAGVQPMPRPGRGLRTSFGAAGR